MALVFAFIIVCVGAGALWLVALFTICFIRLLNETWLDPDWRRSRGWEAGWDEIEWDQAFAHRASPPPRDTRITPQPRNWDIKPR